MFTTIILWTGILALLIIYFSIIKPSRYWKNRGVPHGNIKEFVFDNFMFVLKKDTFPDAIKKIYNRFENSRYSGVHQFYTPSLVIHDPELIKQITIKDFDHFVDHISFGPEDDPMFSKNVLALKGQKWRDMRTILSPSFTSAKMKTIFVIMSEAVDNFTQFFSKQHKDVIEMEMKDIFTRFGNDVIASTAFGIKVDSLKNPKNEFYLMGKDITNFNGFWKMLKFLGYTLAPKFCKIFKISLFGDKATEFFITIVDDTIKAREEKNIVRPDMIHLLMEARKGKLKQEDDGVVDTGFATVQEANIQNGEINKQNELTNLDIAAQAVVFFFGGFDSVTTMMCWLAYELAVQTDIQDRLREEIKETDSNCKGKLTYEALMKMKYMDMVISETLRKWPNNIVTDRVCTKPYTIQPVAPDEKPLHLEPGDTIWIPIYGFHHDEKYFPNPEKFDPERFNDENKSKINPYTYIPFGLGPRNCVGSRFALLEIKTLFYYLLKDFEIVPTKKTTIPPVISKNINLSPEGGFNLGLKKIKY